MQRDENRHDWLLPFMRFSFLDTSLNIFLFLYIGNQFNSTLRLPCELTLVIFPYTFPYYSSGKGFYTRPTSFDVSWYVLGLQSLLTSKPSHSLPYQKFWVTVSSGPLSRRTFLCRWEGVYPFGSGILGTEGNTEGETGRRPRVAPDLSNPSCPGLTETDSV